MQRTTNPFAYGRPITLDTLDDLFSHHRGITGGWSMEGEGGDGGGAGGDGGSGGSTTYTAPATQDELDRIVGDRLARERQKYADYEDLKKKAAEHDAAVEAAKSEAEKAVDAARKEGETTATEKANARIVRAEAKVAAAVAKFRDPEVAVKLLDLTGVTIGDDGAVDAAALKVKLDTLATEHPYLVDDGRPVTRTTQPDPSQGGGGGGDDKPGSIAEARQRAREAREKKTTKAS